MYCSECGQANADAARFCTGCGTALKTVTAVPADTGKYVPSPYAPAAFTPSQPTLAMPVQTAEGDLSPLQVGTNAPDTSLAPALQYGMAADGATLPAGETPQIYGVAPGAVSPFQVTPTEIPPYNPAASEPLNAAPPSGAATPTPVSQPLYGASGQICRVCGTGLVPNMAHCPRCATPIGMVVNANDPTANSYTRVGGSAAPNVSYGAAQTQAPPNNSGQRGVPPAELPAGWNWGAAFATYFWAMAHRVWWYVALQSVLVLILLTLLIGSMATSDTMWAGLLGLAGIFYAAIWLICRVSFGIHGNRMAWRRRRFEHIYQFVDVQEAWKPIGIVLGLIGMMCALAFGGLVILSLIGASMMK